jgi:hypothetical protein
MKYECFQVLHPWAYDLDQVDFKYVINKDQTRTICQALPSLEARVFWLSSFKSQLAVSADEFVAALKEFCVLNQIPEHFEAAYADLVHLMLGSDFALALETHGELVSQHVLRAHQEAQRRYHHSLLSGDQVRFHGPSARARVPAGKNEYLNEEKLAKAYRLGDVPYFEVMQLGRIRGWQLTEAQSLQRLDVRRGTFSVLPNARQREKLYLRFTSVDTDELRDLEVRVDGNLA